MIITDKLIVFFDPSFGALAGEYEHGLKIVLNKPTPIKYLLKNLGFRESDFGFLTLDGVVISPDQNVQNGRYYNCFSIGRIGK